MESSVFLKAVFNHLVLPPQLPGKEDSALDHIDDDIADRLLKATRTIENLASSESSFQTWDQVRRAIQAAKSINVGRKVNKNQLIRELNELHSDAILILHITEQNAGLTIRRHKDSQGDCVTFEAFEASALSESVLAAGRALRRDFPGIAATMTHSEYMDASFQDNLATFLEKASMESIKRFSAHTNKAGTQTFEYRDTSDPALITQLLMTLVEVNGRRTHPALLRKRTRDDVCWSEGAAKPWRRSPLYLILRVAIQRHVYDLYGPEVGRIRYKFLIAMVLGQLLHEFVELISSDACWVLKAKLCRRLAKLETEKEHLSLNALESCRILFQKLGKYLQNIIRHTGDTLETSWRAYKQTVRRKIPILPRKADNRCFYLTLPNSGKYIHNILTHHHGHQGQPAFSAATQYDVSQATTQNFKSFARRYYNLSDLEMENGIVTEDITKHPQLLEARCIEFAEKIEKYLSAVGDSYDSDSEQKSIMLLKVMELWVALDKTAVEICPLLQPFDTGIPPHILNILQLPRLDDMLRLHTIQQHLQRREEQQISNDNRRLNIFHDPVRGCFAERYFDDGPDAVKLYESMVAITEGELQAQDMKKKEWQRLNSHYGSLMTQVAQTSCLFIDSEDVPYRRIHDDHNCTKCYLERKSRRVKITVHEDALPSNVIVAKSVVFELNCPAWFRAYRDATWLIIANVGCSEQQVGIEPHLLVDGYQNLRKYATSFSNGITLGSTTKSFLTSHYATISFPVSIDQVFRPNALKYGYFDQRSRKWPGRTTCKLDFAHHLAFSLPSSSPFSTTSKMLVKTSTSGVLRGPSSNEVIASQTSCPNNINLHEFMAFQDLLSGQVRRWPSILRELSCANLNFSSEATALLIFRLANEAGPTDLSGVENIHRHIHMDFQNSSFCQQLMHQLETRLEPLRTNWREIHSMKIVIDLSLRLCSLSTGFIALEAAQLLQRARGIIAHWLSLLQVEMHKTTASTSSLDCSRYALWAALLLKRTFHIFTDDSAGVWQHKEHIPQIMDAVNLQYFLTASITMQNNLTSDPATLSQGLRRALVFDLKLVHCLRFIIRRSVDMHPESLVSSIRLAWPEPGVGGERIFSRLQYLRPPNEWWARMSVTAPQMRVQNLDFNLIDGSLLVDGQLLGKIPSEYRKHPALQELFGDQQLFVFPSALPDMLYTLTYMPYGHQIHVGFRLPNRNLVVRACVSGRVLELIPRTTFCRSDTSPDLPVPLTEGCIHWLDIQTGILEIRRSPNFWRSQPSNWILNFKTRIATRRNVTLVDPHSNLFKVVARVFDHFEFADQLALYQTRGNLTVELRRLELRFHVNGKGLLESDQLRSEIDRDQDLGCWYGLRSCIVLREVQNLSRRSVIVPLGPLLFKRQGIHTAIKIESKGTFVRYSIDDTLGRLSCAAEPRLIYQKAQLHAYTSFCLPDELTRRTGTEEALSILQYGLSQPFTPLSKGPSELLESLAKLTPTRTYYPATLKHMQKVVWNPGLSFSAQHEAFQPCVYAIQEQSQRLSIFSLQKLDVPNLEFVGSTHLSYRALLRQQLLERVSYSLPGAMEQNEKSRARDEHGKDASSDLLYKSRDHVHRNVRSKINVAEAVYLVNAWPLKFPLPTNLARILYQHSIIGGYTRVFEKPLLSDCLDVDFASEWGALVNKCRSFTSQNRITAAFFFALLSFREDVCMETVRTLIAFTVHDELKSLNLPEWESYSNLPHLGQRPPLAYLVSLMISCGVPYASGELDDFAEAEFSMGARMRRKVGLLQVEHQRKCDEEMVKLAEFMLSQWPCSQPSVAAFPLSPYLNKDHGLDLVSAEWLKSFQNMQFSDSLKQIQSVLDQHHSVIEYPELGTHLDDPEVLPMGRQIEVIPTLTSLLRKALLRPVPSTNIKEFNAVKFSKGEFSPLDGRSKVFKVRTNSTSGPDMIAMDPGKCSPTRHTCGPVFETAVPDVNPEIVALREMTSRMADSKSIVKRKYAKDLQLSLEAFQSTLEAVVVPISDTSLTSAVLDHARQAVETLLFKLRRTLELNVPSAAWLQEGGLWPCMSRIALLQEMASTSSILPGSQKTELIALGLTITRLQRLLRIEDARCKFLGAKAAEELANSGHTNWQPEKYPDWLLLEIENDLLIRPDQVEVALATISPSSGSNSLLQMNMGRGKTSCIIPMVAAVLANSKQLLRVIVPKALLLQTGQLLQARLGGFIGRRVVHVPFSRRTKTDPATIQTYFKLHQEILRSCGIVLALPEHLLSFKLSGLQRISDSRMSEAIPMAKIQSWFERNARDVIDESDLILSLRTQLVYPSGAQNSVDGHPQRWETAEALLRLVEGHTHYLQRKFPRSIQVVHRSCGGFPLIYFLRRDVEEALSWRIVSDVGNGRLTVLPMENYSRNDRQAVMDFISAPKVSQATIQYIRNMFSDKPDLKKTVWLIRGLLIHRILLLCLKKRWSVQYGLHPQRDPIAVPFLAKGVPSDQAEYGHVDVSILLTCLSFYYEGISREQLRQSLSNVLRSDDPCSHYDRWTIAAPDLPDSLRDWNAINVDDNTQVAIIWSHVRFQPAVVDYYLNTFVFPRHAKQFQHKIQASAWDLPLSVSKQVTPAERSVALKREGISRLLTTGFSGTNDVRNMLPLNISQQDLPSLANINAEVLSYLLSPRNRGYQVTADVNGQRSAEENLLITMKNMGIKVLIDAGAQILELDNRALIKLWLIIDTVAPAAVFFDDANKATVRYRAGQEIPLVASTYAEDLSEILVYLDESHCRGTDLPLARNARGALTLGLGLTKDNTVQSAMRLRQLGTTQSVVFFAPPEVDQSIKDLRQPNRRGKIIDSYDVVYWLLDSTCDAIESLMPLYYSQGVEYCKRTQAAIDYPEFLSDKSDRKAYLEILQQREQQTLQQMYEPKLRETRTKSQMEFEPELAGYMKALKARRKGFADLGNAVNASALQEVEQEREVAHEIESIRDVQRPVHFSPHVFAGLHRDISRFVKTGHLAAGSAGAEPAFVALSRTALGRKHGIDVEAIESKLLVSTEFGRTVQCPAGRPNDNFQRPVQWIVWSPSAETALIVCPEEAELIIPVVRRVKSPITYLLTFAAAATRKMLPFNSLDYYSMPPLPLDWIAPSWLKTQLGIFAGRLYFEYDEYEDLCKFLGVGEASAPRANDLEIEVSEGPADVRPEKVRRFTERPLVFLHEWLVVRRKGQSFVHTPTGFVCQGKPLSVDDPFFSTREEGGPGDRNTTSAVRGPGDEAFGSQDEDDVVDDDSMFGDEDVELAGDGESEDEVKTWNYSEGEQVSDSESDTDVEWEK